MIVHDQVPKFVYVDIPKAGSRSAHVWLRDLFPAAKNVGDHRRDLEHAWRRYLLFATIRSPYTRAISAWCSAIRDDKFDLKLVEALVDGYGDASIESFMAWFVDGAPRRRDKDSFWPMSNQFEHLAPLAQAVGGWDRVTLLRLETIRSDVIQLPFICRRMAARFPQENAAVNPPSVASMSSIFIDRVNAWAAEDFYHLLYKRITPSAVSSGGSAPNDDEPS